jgi:hypothetical protein
VWNVANLLSRDEKRDGEVALLEHTVDSAVEGWDQAVQHAIDVARGK